MTTKKLSWLAGALLVSFTLLVALQVRAGGWERVTEEHGIVVKQKQVAGRDLPTFRGVGVVHGSIHEVLAVLTDVDRHTEWMHQCMTSRLLKKKSNKVRFIYNRTDAPWPVSDRDVVLRSEVKIIAPGMRIDAHFKSVGGRLMGKVGGVVRMPQLEGHYKLQALDTDRTRVTYQVNADPGGSLPTWIAKRATRELPLFTIKNLRRQVRKTRGDYDDFIARWKQTQAL